MSGFPREAFGFYPTTHDGGDQLLFGTGRAIAFGNDTTLKKYAPYRHIQVHGSGRSKILIGDDYLGEWRASDWEEQPGTPEEAVEQRAAEIEAEYSVERLRSMVDNGGREA